MRAAAGSSNRPRSDPPNCRPGGPGPEATALLNDEMRRLAERLALLPDEQREVLALRFGVGLSVKEIAAVIGKSESAAQMRLWRALHVIRKDR